MTEQLIANCISMEGNEETVAVEWPKLREQVFEFLCRYQWRVGEKPTCIDQHGNQIRVEAATPDWMEFITRRYPLPLKFTLPDTDIGEGVSRDETVLRIAPIYGLSITHEWWIRNSVQMSGGLPYPLHAETWHWTDVASEGLALPPRKRTYLQ